MRGRGARAPVERENTRDLLLFRQIQHFPISIKYCCMFVFNQFYLTCYTQADNTTPEGTGPLLRSTTIKNKERNKGERRKGKEKDS